VPVNLPIAVRRLALLTAAVLLAGCGGGGADSPAPPPPPPVAATPTAVADSAAALWYRDTTVDVVANDRVTAGGLSVTAVSTPAHGVASLVAGKVVYTPAPGFVGTDTLQYTLRADQGGATTTGQLSISVKGRLTLEGSVAHAAGASASVSAVVGSSPVATTADAQGRYVVEIESDSLDHLVRVDAAGAAERAVLKQRSLLPTFGTLASRANAQGRVNQSTEPRLGLSAGTTSMAMLAAVAQGGVLPGTAAELKQALGLIDPNQWLDVGAALSTLLDGAAALPAGVGDTLAITASHQVHSAMLYRLITRDPADYAARREAIAADTPTLAPAAPTNGGPSRWAYFLEGADSPERMQLVEYQPTATALACTVDACLPGRWALHPDRLEMSFDTPILFQNSETEEGTGALIQVEFRTLALRIRVLAINDQMVLITRPTTKTFLDGQRRGETITWVPATDPGDALRMADVQQRLPVLADDFSVGRIWAGLRGEFDVEPENAAEQDVMRITAPGKARSELTGREYTLSLAENRLVVSRAGGNSTHEYVKLRTDPRTGEQHWLVIGPEKPGGDSRAARVRVLLPAALPPLGSVSLLGWWANTPSSRGMLFQQMLPSPGGGTPPLGAGIEHSWTPAGPPTQVNTTWEPKANPEQFELVRPRTPTRRRMRHWVPLTTTPDAMWVHETITEVSDTPAAPSFVLIRRLVRKTKETAPWL
jgi:Bacterial Ig domain